MSLFSLTCVAQSFRMTAQSQWALMMRHMTRFQTYFLLWRGIPFSISALMSREDDTTLRLKLYSWRYYAMSFPATASRKPATALLTFQISSSQNTVEQRDMNAKIVDDWCDYFRWIYVFAEREIRVVWWTSANTLTSPHPCTHHPSSYILLDLESFCDFQDWLMSQSSC